MTDSELHRRLALTYQESAEHWHREARKMHDLARWIGAVDCQRRAAKMAEHARMQLNTCQAYDKRSL